MRLQQLKRFLCCLPLILLFAACQSPGDKESAFAIMGYYVPGEAAPASLPLDQLTHIIFSFTKVIDNEMKFENKEMGDQLRLLVEQKKNHPKLKVMVACGGWGGSGGFSKMVSSPETRKKFIESVAAFIQQYDLDGLDMDWEYPGLPGNDNPHQPEDRENFTLLMQELRAVMDAIDPDLVLSFASAGWEAYYDHIELTEVMKHVDYMNIMTYDQTGGYAAITGHHTNLMSTTENPRSAHYIISYCLDQGVAPEQLVIGAAFYGKTWKGVPPENNGLSQPTQGAWKNAIVYSDIEELYENKNGFVRYWDQKAQAAFLYRAADSLFITYDDAESVALKTAYAKEKRLGGIMFWQLSQDTKSSSLLNAIQEAALN